MAGKHGQHRSIQETHEKRCQAVNEESRQESLHVELAEEGVAGTGPTDESSRCEQVHRIPDAVILDETEDCRGKRHRSATGDASPDSRGDVEGLDGQNSAWRFALGMRSPTFRESAGADAYDLLAAHGDGFMRLVRQH